MKTQYVLRVTSIIFGSEEKITKESFIDGEDYFLVQKVIRALKTVEEENNWANPKSDFEELLTTDEINDFSDFVGESGYSTIKSIKMAPHFQWSVLF